LLAVRLSVSKAMGRRGKKNAVSAIKEMITESQRRDTSPVSLASSRTSSLGRTFQTCSQELEKKVGDFVQAEGKSKLELEKKEEELNKSKQEPEKKVREFVQAEEKLKQQLEEKEEELKKSQQELAKKAKELVQAEEKCFVKLKTKEKEIQKSYKNVQELKRALSKKEEELEKQNEKVVKHEKLVAVLEERLECPVCLDIPTTGPIYTCSNGHCICSACYQGKASNCPVCRTRMFESISMVAAAVVANIDHRCRHEGCLERLPVELKEEHRRVCAFRPVTCPALRCNAKVAYSLLVDHLLNHCKESASKEHGMWDMKNSSETYPFIYSTNKEEEGNSSSIRVMTMMWRSKYFFLTVQKMAGSLWNIYVQMLGTREECRRYRVTITVEEKEKGLVETSCRPPHPIYEEFQDIQGLVVNDDAMKDMAVKHQNGKDVFYVKLKFETI